MALVVPSQVVDFIRMSFPEGRFDLSQGAATLREGDRTLCAVLVNLIDRIPNELITLDTADFTKFLAATEAIRSMLPIWLERNLALTVPPGFDNQQIIEVILELLEKCPDQAPKQSTSGLKFVKSVDLRKVLRIDIAAADQALHGGEWKAATVIAGSVIEALLLSAIGAKPPVVVGSAQTKLKISKPLNELHLPDYIKLAFELRIIDAATQKQAELAKDFRNLIHPGRAQRLKQKCDRGTALSALAAMELVIRDLS